MSKGYILNNNDDTIFGLKTFDQFPLTPNAFPIAPLEVANKQYVDTFALGLQVKAAVRVATVVPGTLATDFENGDTVDGVVLATNDRILIKDQVSALENGIYTVNASGAPTRATDYDTSGEVGAGTFTTVLMGTQANTQWVQITVNPTLNTDPLVFSQLSGVATPSGSDTWVQFNNMGLFGASQYFTFDYTFQNLIVGSSAYPNGLLSLQGGGIAYLGDVGANVNSTLITVNDTGKYILLGTGGPTILLDGASGPITYTAKQHLFATATYTGGMAEFNEFGVAAIGDLQGTVNGTQLVVSDPGQSIQIYAGLNYLFQSLTYIGGFFSFDDTAEQLKLGDFNGGHNQTWFLLDDAAQTFQFLDSSGIITEINSAFIQIGHTSTAYGPEILMTSATTTIDVTCSNLNAGDLNGWGNGTSIHIDDVNQIINFIASTTGLTINGASTFNYFTGFLGLTTPSPITDLDITRSSVAAGTVGLNIRNATNTGMSQIQIQSATASSHYQFNYYNSLHAPVGLLVAGAASIETNAPAGLIIGMTTANKPIIFALGGTGTANEVARIISTGMGIGTLGDPDPSAILDLVSTTQGLAVPRMTTVQKLAIVSPIKSLIVYDTTLDHFFGYNGAWVQLD